MVEIGAILYLELINKSNQETDRYKCRIVDLMDGALIIDVPINEKTRKFAVMIGGEEYSATFIGKDSALYSFQTSVIEKMKGQIPTIKIVDPGTKLYKRIQRRNYVRVDASVDVTLQSVDGSWEPFLTRTVDVSGGGVSLLVPPGKQLPKKAPFISIITIARKTKKEIKIKAVCQMVRLQTKKINNTDVASLKFISISEQDREQIIQFCFEVQLEMKRIK